jgi:ribulose-phosphate 3-epimerase
LLACVEKDAVMNHPLRLEASLLSADPAALGDAVRYAHAAGVDALHYDVMDGRFVPNITFGMPTLQALTALSPLPIHAHLMIVEPQEHIAAFAQAGARMIWLHAEACTHLHRALSAVRALDVSAGVALNPSTPLSAVEEVLDLCHSVLVMTVNPGFGGQAFIHSQRDKIRRLRALIVARGLSVSIAVDGGIDAQTAPLAWAAGADTLAAGSSIYARHYTAVTVRDHVAALRAAVPHTT